MVHRPRFPRLIPTHRPHTIDGEFVRPVRERDPALRARRAAEQADAYLAAHRRRRREQRPSSR
jgi:hypothetical protein